MKMEYVVKFVVNTDDGLTDESRKGNSLYVTKWFDKLSEIIARSENDLLIDIDPYSMRLLSVEQW